MTSPAPGQIQIKDAMLFICDSTGKVQAVSSKAVGDTFPETSFLQRDVGELLGLGSSINIWLEDRIQEARKHDEYFAETIVENGKGKLSVRLDVLNHDRELYGFALQVLPVQS